MEDGEGEDGGEIWGRRWSKRDEGRSGKYGGEDEGPEESQPGRGGVWLIFGRGGPPFPFSSAMASERVRASFLYAEEGEGRVGLPLSRLFGRLSSFRLIFFKKKYQLFQFITDL